MAWVRKDENAALHPKFFRAGVAAYGWHDAALGYCNRYLTDGFVPSRDLLLIFPGTLPDVVTEIVEVLVREGLLEVRAEGYAMHDYAHYQPLRKDVLRERRRLSARGRQGGINSGISRKRAASTRYEAPACGETKPDPARPAPARPDPARPAPARPVPEGAAGAPPRSAAVVLTDDQFITALRANPAYQSIDLDRELAKMDAFLLTPKGRGRKKTRQFIVNWLNRIDRPMVGTARPVSRAVAAIEAANRHTLELLLPHGATT
jgi:hypothetical protein